MSKNQFKNKVVVITGGSKGLGYGAAEMFVNSGAHVFIHGRDSKALAQAKNDLGDRLYPVEGDVSSLDDIDSLYARVRERFDHIDVLLANTGTNVLSRLVDVTEENYDKIFDVNTKGAFFTVQKSLGLLQRGSSVIFVSSTAAHTAETGDGVYAGSKASLILFAKTFSAEHALEGIRFNVITPTMTRTPLLESLGDEEFLRYWAKKHPPGRLAEVADFVGAVKFLASEDSGFIYGQDIVVDGGKCDKIEFIETLKSSGR